MATSRKPRAPIASVPPDRRQRRAPATKPKPAPLRLILAPLIQDKDSGYITQALECGHLLRVTADPKPNQKRARCHECQRPVQVGDTVRTVSGMQGEVIEASRHGWRAPDYTVLVRGGDHFPVFNAFLRNLTVIARGEQSLRIAALDAPKPKAGRAA